MSALTVRPAASRLAPRRLVGPFVTIVAAAAGLYAGTRVAERAGEIAIPAMLLVVGACVLVAWLVSGTGPDLLASRGLEAFRAELDRARRHRRTFAMARLELVQPVEAAGDPASRDGIDRATIALIGASLRITDHAWLYDGDAIILLPESDRTTAEAFASRIRASAPGRFTSRIGLAVFPDDGLTSGALLDALEGGLRGDARPSPLVRTLVDAATPAEPDGAAATTGSGVG